MIRSDNRDNRHGGFTLLETLLTVAVLVILLGLSAVGVAYYRDPLKITELDNTARAIYMAAENRAVLLQNSGAAATLLSSGPPAGGGDTSLTLDDGTTVALRVLSNASGADALDDLLPAGTIDPALRDGRFYILYDKDTCHVFEVFYAQNPFEPDSLDDLRDKSRSDRIKAFRSGQVPCLVGHYAGDLADKFNTLLPTPGVKALIENGEELTLTVTYSLPSNLPAGVIYSPSVKLVYEGIPVELLSVDAATGNCVAVDGGRLTKTGDFGTAGAGDVVKYVWTLDSLESGKQFKGFFTDAVPTELGKDFKVTASLKLSADGYIESSYSASGEDNSLFDTSSTADTAMLANLRHLQNLDTDFSNAAGKTKVVQLATIDCGTYKGGNYAFIPIENWALASYEASPNGTEAYSIKNLKITSASATKTNTGLFGGVNTNFVFSNVHLVDSSIQGHVGAHIGGLAGTAPSGTFTNCSLENVTVASPDEWSWSYVGGLVGNWWDGVTFKNCEARNLTVTSSGANAGGLAGGGQGAVFIDCMVGNPGSAETDKAVKITAAVYAGGLVGNSEANGSFEGCAVVNVQVTGTGNGSGVGGLAGRATTTELKACTASNLIVEGVGNAGGLVGGTDRVSMNKDGDKPCIAENVAVTAVEYAGGLVGNSVGDELTGCKAVNAKVTGTGNDSYAGGLAGGAKWAAFRNCAAENAAVEAAIYSGGLIGRSEEDGKFTGCKAINAKVTGTGAASEAGGLAGAVEGRTQLVECQVYWTDLSGLVKNGVLQYQVAGNTAGGLVGTVRKSGTIQSSFAATLTRAAKYTGGLVGNLAELGRDEDDNPLKDENGNVIISVVSIQKSYASCYLHAGAGVTGQPYTGGLIGMKAPYVTLSLEDAYAVGIMEIAGAGAGEDEKMKAAGLCGGSAGDITAQNVYVAMVMQGNYPFEHYPLMEESNNKIINCFFHNYVINPEGVATLVKDSVSYETITSDSFVNEMGGAFTKPVETHPYNLLPGVSPGGAYPFPGLWGLPHYGDWKTY